MRSGATVDNRGETWALDGAHGLQDGPALMSQRRNTMSDEYNNAYANGFRAGLEKAQAILAETAVGRPDGWAAHDEAGTLIGNTITELPEADRALVLNPLDGAPHVDNV